MKSLLKYASLLFIAAMLLAACGGQPTAAPTEAATEAPTEVMTEAPTEAATEAPTEAATDAPAEEPGTGAAFTCPANVEEGASIVFAGWGDETEQQIYRDSIDRFSAVCPGVTVEYQPVPTEFQDKLKAQMAGGTAPDVFYVDDQLMTAFAPSGQLLALDPYMDEAGISRDDFIPALMTIFTQDGQTYALPKDWGTLGLVYLPAAFEASGIDEPTEDWTWEDMRTAAQAIADTGTYGGFCMG